MHAEVQGETHPRVQIFPEVSKPISFATHGQALDEGALASNCYMLKPSTSARQAARGIIVLGACEGLAVNQC